MHINLGCLFGKERMNYQEFLKTKELKSIQAGFDVHSEWLSDKLFDFQRDIVKWAIKKGKAVIE